MNTAIEVHGLTKQYGNHIVLKNLNFTVYEGEIFALLGVNGAGKTTTLECIEGLKKADGGQIRINGKMGIQLQSASLPERIQAREAVSLFAYWNRAGSGVIGNNGNSGVCEKTICSAVNRSKTAASFSSGADRESGYSDFG